MSAMFEFIVSYFSYHVSKTAASMLNRKFNLIRP